MGEKIARSVGTHDGPFHADEVSACALLSVYDLVDADKIVRTRDLNKLERCEFVCDVGGEFDPEKGRFDHHQLTYKGPLSSAGMVLDFLRDFQHIDEEEHQFLRSMLIKGIDDHDNGRSKQIDGVCTFSHVIANFMPISYDAGELDFEEAFGHAFRFACDHLERLRERHAYSLSCRALVKEAMDRQDQYLLFEKKIPWLESFFALGGDSHPARFVIMPAADHWKLRAIPPSLADRMNVRQPLPEKWAGLLGDELKAVSKIPGAIFCHKGQFISVWETREGVFKALEFVLAEGESV